MVSLGADDLVGVGDRGTLDFVALPFVARKIAALVAGVAVFGVAGCRDDAGSGSPIDSKDGTSANSSRPTSWPKLLA
jgi:hypothetical protein